MKVTLPVPPAISLAAAVLVAGLYGCGEQSTPRVEAVAPAPQAKESLNEDYLAQLRTSAEAGNADAQFNLGWIYMRGEGFTGITYARDVPRDLAKAHDWFQKAAAQGHVNAQYNLGMLYKLGLGVKADAANAFLWLEKAAAQGNDLAQYHLGAMYAEGAGVERHLPRACAWSILAAAQNNEKAKRNFLEIGAKLTPAENNECQQLATNWKKGEGI